MTDNIKTLDPVQGLIDYVNDIKPFHTKVIETLVEYVGFESVNATIREQYIMEIGLNYAYNTPISECINAVGGQTIVNTTIPVRSNITFVGSPPMQLYDFNDTIVYVNGILQTESLGIGSPPTGDYTISGPNQITFSNPLVDGDEVKVYTFTQLQQAPNQCLLGGYGTNGFGFPSNIPVLSPNMAIALPAFPAISANTLIVLGDQTKLFNPSKNISFQLNSYIENPILGTMVADISNTGSFLVISSSVTPKTLVTSEYTTITLSGLVLVPPVVPVDPNEKYVSIISLGGITYNSILSYSNTFETINAGSPLPNEVQVPDEGYIFTPIVAINGGSPGSFVISGDFRGSNLFEQDTFTISNSMGNDGTYVISNITYDIVMNETTLTTSSIITELAVSGDITLIIPANVFLISGDYTDFFNQGTVISVLSGSAIGVYTTLLSFFNNNQTYIRVIEDIISGSGISIVGTVAAPDGIIVSGDQSGTYLTGTTFNIASAMLNNGSFTASANSTYDIVNDETTILVNESLDTTDITGNIHEFISGNLVNISPGFGQSSLICEELPSTLVKIGIIDTLTVQTTTGGSPIIPMFQYFIINTSNVAGSPIGVNSISVHGDATNDIINGNTITIIHSNFSPSNDGIYTVSSIPTYNIGQDFTTFNVLEGINNVGNSGGWVEGILP